MAQAGRVNLRHELDRLRRTRGERLSLDRIGVAIAAFACTLLMFQLITSARGGEPVAADAIAGPSSADVAAGALPPHLRERRDRRVENGSSAGFSVPDGGRRESGEAEGAARLEVEYGWAGPTAVIDDGWRTRRIELRPAAVEIDGVALPTAATEVVADDAWIEYHRGAVVEWFADGPGGLVHGLTIEDAPSAAQLEVRLSRGAVAIRPDAAGDGVRAGRPVLHYAGVRARDASGAELRAVANAVGTGLALSIDVRDARYPVVIGPLRLAVRGERPRQRVDALPPRATR